MPYEFQHDNCQVINVRKNLPELRLRATFAPDPTTLIADVLINGTDKHTWAITKRVETYLRKKNLVSPEAGVFVWEYKRDGTLNDDFCRRWYDKAGRIYKQRRNKDGTYSFR
jgi:hypothetical protein